MTRKIKAARVIQGLFSQDRAEGKYWYLRALTELAKFQEKRPWEAKKHE